MSHVVWCSSANGPQTARKRPANGPHIESMLWGQGHGGVSSFRSPALGGRRFQGCLCAEGHSLKRNLGSPITWAVAGAGLVG